jgi:hypothetical protein
MSRVTEQHLDLFSAFESRFAASESRLSAMSL